MIFSDFRKGMIVWHARSNNAINTRSIRGTGHPVETLKYYVLEINEAKRQVFASCNGASPSWYNVGKYKHWQSTKPEDNPIPKRFRVE